MRKPRRWLLAVFAAIHLAIGSELLLQAPVRTSGPAFNDLRMVGRHVDSAEPLLVVALAYLAVAGMLIAAQVGPQSVAKVGMYGGMFLTAFYGLLSLLSAHSAGPGQVASFTGGTFVLGIAALHGVAVHSLGR